MRTTSCAARCGRALALLLVAGPVLAGCQRNATPEAVAPEPAIVAEAVVRTEPVREAILGTGSIHAEKTTELGPRVDGLIEAIAVDVGDFVEEGDLLFRTRAVDYELRVRRAENALRLARAELQQADRDLRRAEDLHREHVVSDDRLDGVRTAHEIARARVGEAEAALAQVRQSLRDTEVRAPYAGVITARRVDEGTMRRTMMSSGAGVVQLMKTDRVRAVVQVPAVHLARVRVGTPARVEVDGLPGILEGSVAVLNDRVDDRTRAFEVRIPLENPERRLKPGLFVRAQLEPEPRPARVLERGALRGGEGERYVFQAEDGRARRRPVEVRDLDADRVEVVAGLEAGDRVLVGPGLARLREGDPVTIEARHADR